MKIKLYIQIAFIAFFQSNSFCQTLPMTKENVIANGIETITYKKYSLKKELIQVKIEFYDLTGKLILEKNKSVDKDVEYTMDFMKDAIDYSTSYKYDLNNNLIEENMVNDFFPMKSKWEYEYDETNMIIKKTTFNLHNRPNQTNHYSYDQQGQIEKDSIAQKGKPFSVTKFIYKNDKLIKKITKRAYKAKYQISEIDDYYYDNNNRLIKIAFFRSRSSGDDMTDTFAYKYKYNKKGKLKEEIFPDKKFKYFYNKEDLIFKRYYYQRTERKRPKYKKVEYDIIEYTFYN